MNWAIAFPAAAFLGELMLLALVSKGARRSLAGQSLALYLTAMTLASFSSWMMHAEAWPGPSFWWKLIITAGVLQAPLVVRFATLFPRSRPRWQQRLVLWPWYLFSIVVLVLNASGYVAGDARGLPNQQGVIEVEFGPAGPLVFLSILLNLLSVTGLYVQFYRGTRNEAERRSVLYPLAGAALVVLGGLINISPLVSRYPIDQLLYLGNAALISYAILRHRMLGIRSALRRGAVYSLLTVLITLIFLVAALVSSQGLLGGLPDSRDLAGIVAVAFFVSVAYQPLRGRLQRAVDRLFFRESYEYGPTLEEFSRRVSTLLDLHELAEATVETIIGTVQVSAAALFVQDQQHGDFELLASRGSEGLSRARERLEAAAWFPDKDDGLLLSATEREEGSQLLTDAGFSVALPFWANEELIGFLLLGHKLSGEPYFGEDLMLLSTFANQIGTVLENARLFNELEASEQERAFLVEEMNEGYILSQGLVVRFANKRFAEMLGYGVEEVVGSPFSRFFSPGTTLRAAKLSEAMKEGGATPSLVTGTAVRRDGSEVRIEASVRVTEYQGQPAVTGIVRDVTERERLQERMLQTEKLRALGQMAGGVAHDLSNTLAVVLSRVELCQRLLARPEIQHGRIREHVAVVLQAVEDGSQTLARLRQFAATRTDPPRSALAQTDLNEIVRGAADLTSPRWRDQPRAQGIVVTLETELGDLPPIRANSPELREVLTNLIFNALDAMANGGVLTLRTWAEGRNACFSVSDTGTGMTEEVRRRCFEPFFSTKGPESLGLGLSTSYAAVERHGGDISVDSAPGEGSTFVVRLPLGTQASRAAASEEPTGDPSSARLLIVDDEQDVREAFLAMLTEAGHQPEAASGGPEALHRLEQEEFDVVMLDLVMPEMNGWDVAQAIRAKWPHVPIILVTGWGQRVENANERWVDVIVHKPARRAEILAAIERVLV